MPPSAELSSQTVSSSPGTSGKLPRNVAGYPESQPFLDAWPQQPTIQVGLPSCKTSSFRPNSESSRRSVVSRSPKLSVTTRWQKVCFKRLGSEPKPVTGRETDLQVISVGQISAGGGGGGVPSFSSRRHSPLWCCLAHLHQRRPAQDRLRIALQTRRGTRRQRGEGP